MCIKKFWKHTQLTLGQDRDMRKLTGRQGDSQLYLPCSVLKRFIPQTWITFIQWWESLGSSLRASLAGLCRGTLALLSSELAPLLTSWEPWIRFIFHLTFPTSGYWPWGGQDNAEESLMSPELALQSEGTGGCFCCLSSES